MNDNTGRLRHYREIDVDDVCTPEFQTLDGPCPAGRTLVASPDSGCVCILNARVVPAQRCSTLIYTPLFFGIVMLTYLFVDNPTTAGTGFASCVNRYDGTDAKCGVKCNPPYVFLTFKLFAVD